MSANSSHNLAIHARGLVKKFGDLHAVDGIDLDVPRGMIFAILGPNGAGKTTLMRMLATLLGPDAGSASVMGHDLVAAPQDVRGAIAMTGQFASLDEDLTGRENLMLLARLWGFRGGAARGRADELLVTFDLADAANKQVKDYSGGMRRRLDIAASLIVTPGVLFLDEPTTGLDPVARKSVWRMIRALAGSGYRVVPVSDAGSAPGRAGGKMRGRKRLQCPKCERTFAHPLPMSRHLKATHNVTVGGKKKGRRKTA